MTTIPHSAPGCFGSALGFAADNAVCRNCVFAETCEPLHRVNLQTLRATFNIKPPKVRLKAAEESGSECEALATVKSVPSKVAVYLKRFEDAGIRIVESLQARRNPFGAEAKFMACAAHALLKLDEIDRPLRRASLATMISKKLGCSETTGEAYARMALQILYHVGAIDVIDGAYRLRKPNTI